MGYSYRQPYTQDLCALFIEEGNGAGPRCVYYKYGIDGDWERNNPSDIFVWGFYVDINGITRSSGSESDIDNCIANPNCQIGSYICDHVVRKLYVDSTSNIKGSVYLQIRLRAWWDQEGLCDHDYLPTRTLGILGNPMVTNLRMTSFQLPDIAGDPCYNVNIHSKIEGRFIVLEWHDTGPDPIQNFYDAGEDITFMIKSLGIAYLKHP